MRQDGPKDDLPTTPLTNDGTVRTLDRSAEPEVGAHLGQFRVEARIGQGGLGVVYRAYDEKLARPVALKVLVDSSSAAAAHLLAEARAAASLTHPSIAAIHDVQQHLGIAFIVMELVPGETLRARIRRGPVPRDAALSYARDIAAGLARAHGSGIVHRDLKPENVIVTPDGNAKILDFGLARETPEGPAPSSRAGVTGIAGTPNYMAPEQARGGRVDARADVFSFGVVLYELLSGKRPFAQVPGERGSEAEAWPILTPLDEAAPGLPPELVRIVERCMAFERAERFPDGAAVLAALRSVELPARRPAARGILWASLGLVVAGALGLGVVGRWTGIAAGVPPAPSASGAPTAGAPSAEPAFALTSTPEPIPGAGLCSSFPVFADDGTLVFSRQDASGSEIYRRDLATGRETPLTDDRANSLRPSRGAAGEIVYLFRKKGEDGGNEVRSVALAGGPSRRLLSGEDPVVARDHLFFLQADSRAIRRRAVDGGDEDLLYEAPPSLVFDSLNVSPDARWLATSTSGIESRTATPVCFAPLGEARDPLDCTSAGMMTSRRPTFSPGGGALYFARGDSLVRVDLATRATTSTRVTPAPTSFAFGPDGATLVSSTCRLQYEALRIDPDGRTTPLPAVAAEVGILAVGPHGELAFPVGHEGQVSLGVADGAGPDVRIMTGAGHDVTETAFSPDAKRVAFHDATPVTGGLFVANLDGNSAPTRVTTFADDASPSWLDDEHIVYLHAEKGLPYGRVYVVSAAGGEAKALPRLPGVLIGAVPARGTLLMGIRSPSGDRFVEATQTGRMRDLPLRGVPKGMQWEVSTASSSSGRYVAWYSGGAAWKGDLDAGVASRVDFAWPAGDADSLQPDDQGRLTVSFRHYEGQLYVARGRFP
ncbi:MAG TPA: protein kinase [Polyangiaceae bacterium]